MKEMGIIMTGNHPKLILDGIKTMTRRVIKPQPFKCEHCGDLAIVDKKGFYRHLSNMKDGGCPYGQVGDRLWVRETWRPYSEKDVRIEYKADGSIVDYPEQPQFSFYACGQNWHPSLFMPRWASRILLEITDIRVEHLNQISDSDVMKEGVDDLVTFMLLWDRLNKKRGYGWEMNPWVFVISFRRLKQ